MVNIYNFINPDKFTPSYDWAENCICYIGRLSDEKGVSDLIQAVMRIPNIKLKIIGTGPTKEKLKFLAKDAKNIFFFGYKSGEELKNEIINSMFTVIPSRWYENNPFSV